MLKKVLLHSKTKKCNTTHNYGYVMYGWLTFVASMALGSILLRTGSIL